MLRSAIVLAAFTACITPTLADPAYISFQIQDAMLTEPYAINSAGDVTGSFVETNYQSHGFVRLHDGTIQTFDVGGAHSGVRPLKINDRGEVMGTFYGGGKPRGFLRSPDGTLKMIDAPGVHYTYPTGLNNSGALTGYGITDDGKTYHGFTRKAGGGKKSFDILDATRTQPGAINDNGTVAGVYYLGDFPYYGFIRDRKGNITTFSSSQDSFYNVVGISNTGIIGGNMLFDGGFVRAPDGTMKIFEIHHRPTFVYGMNTDGATTGTVKTGRNQKAHGFLRASDGAATVFDYPGTKAGTYPTAINDSNVITGNYSGDGVSLGFVRTP